MGDWIATVTPQETFSWLARQENVTAAIDRLPDSDIRRMLAYATAHLGRCWGHQIEDRLLEVACVIGHRYRTSTLNPDTEGYARLLSALAVEADRARDLRDAQQW